MHYAERRRLRLGRWMMRALAMAAALMFCAGCWLIAECARWALWLDPDSPRRMPPKPMEP